MKQQNLHTVRRGGFREDTIREWERMESDPGVLMDFLSAKTGETRRTRLKSWLSHGQVAIDGVVTSQFDAPLEEGRKVELNLTRGFVRFRHPRVKLVYEDDDIIVVEKGYGLLSVATGAGKGETTAYSIVRDYLKEKSAGNKVFIVHRLDRDTTGLLMFAKNPEAKEAMQHNWNNMVLDRKYVAVVEGSPARKEGVIKSYLGETSQHEVYSTADPNGGKEAVTEFRTLKRGKRFSLVEFSLDTGRKNQIRVHAKAMGCPISGDRKYGAGASPLRRLCLHAHTLHFVHPVSRKLMKFTSPMPGGFLRITGFGEKEI